MISVPVASDEERFSAAFSVDFGHSADVPPKRGAQHEEYADGDGVGRLESLSAKAIREVTLFFLYRLNKRQQVHHSRAGQLWVRIHRQKNWTP